MMENPADGRLRPGVCKSEVFLLGLSYVRQLMPHVHVWRNLVETEPTIKIHVFQGEGSSDHWKCEDHHLGIGFGGDRRHA